MNIGFTTGYYEEFWAGWPWIGAYGGSEHMVVELAAEMAVQGHSVTVRLPRRLPEERQWRGVRWIGLEASSQSYDVLFNFDDPRPRDKASRQLLVVCRDRRVHMPGVRVKTAYLSAFHARYNEEPLGLVLGGGVNPTDYDVLQVKRKPRMVLYTSSPDRGGKHAERIGRDFDFVATYRGGREVSRKELIELQQQAQVLIHPCDPRRPAEFFCMSVLEAMAAGTPCIISDADALPELWGDAAIVLPRPIRYYDWIRITEELIADRKRWMKFQTFGRIKASTFAWRRQAVRYLEAALEA